MKESVALCMMEIKGKEIGNKIALELKLKERRFVEDFKDGENHD